MSSPAAPSSFPGAALGAAAIAAGLLFAQPAGAFTPERAAIMVDAVRANGCQMRGSEAPAALEPLGLDAIEVQSFVDILFGADLVSISEDQQTLTLSEPLCAAQGEAALEMITAAFAAQEASLEPWRPDFAPERGAALVGIIRENACAMTEEEAGDLLPGAGFDPALTRDIVTVLLDTGLARFDPQTASLALSDDLCGAEVSGDEAAVADAVARWIAANTDGTGAGETGAGETGADETAGGADQ